MNNFEERNSIAVFIPQSNGGKRDEKSPQIYEVLLTMYGLGREIRIVRSPDHRGY